MKRFITGEKLTDDPAELGKIDMKILVDKYITHLHQMEEELEKSKLKLEACKKDLEEERSKPGRSAQMSAISPTEDRNHLEERVKFKRFGKILVLISSLSRWKEQQQLSEEENAQRNVKHHESRYSNKFLQSALHEVEKIKDVVEVYKQRQENELESARLKILMEEKVGSHPSIVIP